MPRSTVWRRLGSWSASCHSSRTLRCTASGRTYYASERTRGRLGMDVGDAIWREDLDGVCAQAPRRCAARNAQAAARIDAVSS